MFDSSHDLVTPSLVIVFDKQILDVRGSIIITDSFIVSDEAPGTFPAHLSVFGNFQIPYHL